MEINKKQLEDGSYEIEITKGSQVFKMLFGGNGDLYWHLINKERPFSDQEFFTIDKENYALYESFAKLYYRIANCELYDIDPIELSFCETREEEQELENRKNELNEKAKSSSEYTDLYSEGGITFVSDEDVPYYMSNRVSIVEDYDKESFIIEFDRVSDERDLLDIRFRTSGSRYPSFISVFLKQYHELCEEDYDYHQIHFEEYMYQKKLKKHQ